MGTITEKLNYLSDTKVAIKDAIVAKGVEVADTDSFRSYAEKIASIEGGGSSSQTRLIYLTRSGSGYIDTGVTASGRDLRLSILYTLDTLPSSYWNLVSAYVNESTNATRILLYGTRATYCNMDSKAGDSLAASIARVVGVYYSEELYMQDEGTIKYTSNGATYTKAKTTGTSLGSTTIKLFGTGVNDGVTINLYRFTIHEGDTIIRDFIPHINNDGEYGLYDIVNQQFYGNSGQGEFSGESVII